MTESRGPRNSTRIGYPHPRHGCHHGGCGVDVMHGEVHYNRPVADTVLSPEERRAGVCLSCRAVPNGDVVVALRDDHLRRVNPFARPRTVS